MNDELLLRVSQLSVGFNTELGPVRVVENVSFAVPRGHTVGLVGESGCGKSVTAHTIMRLLPSPPSRIDSGQLEPREISRRRRPACWPKPTMNGGRIHWLAQP